MRKLVFVIISFSIIANMFAQNDDSIFIRRIADEILVNGKAYENLHQLTKQISGRLAGSPQMVKAEEWGLRIMKESGADKSWLQECMVPHWVRGGQDQATAEFKGGKKSLDIVALGNSQGTGAKGVRAEVIEIDSFEELEMKHDQIKNKIVFYNYKFNPKFIRTFLSYGDAVRYRGQGASRGAKYGAVGVIIRSMSHSTDNNPHTGAMNYIDSISTQKIPAVAIGLRDADWLSNILQKEKEKQKVKVFIKTNGHFLPDTIGHNVIGEITGSQFPNQVITVGGHLDSWDVAEGAHDDGAGCVQTIEILRAFKALNYTPIHTIRFVLFANEENGTRGADKYAAEANAKGEKHIFALESDAGGFTPRGFGFTVPDSLYQKVLSWKELFTPYGASEFSRGGGGSDIGPLGHTFRTPLAGLSPDSQRYFDLHHARNDVFEAVNKRELELGAINMAALIYLVDKYGL